MEQIKLGAIPNFCYICGAIPVTRKASTVFNNLFIGLCAEHAKCKVACTSSFPPQFVFIDEEGKEVVPAFKKW